MIFLYDEKLKSNGRVLLKKKGTKDWVCQCCFQKFLYSYDVIRHICLRIEPLKAFQEE